MKVSEAMTAPPISVAPHVSLLEVTRRMTESAVGSVLVVEDGALRGIVTDRAPYAAWAEAWTGRREWTR
ncbi:CBS domain-containing protein [Streptomyces sp. WAC00263]|uniref:CBS domain-containing protein n=1 Tax=Streptomyces sp. WAC00263 TaxID=1917422 RepID=UPI001F514DA8|nr:CBS domain-containing protein [Streptomyces sp. WAC00263]